MASKAFAKSFLSFYRFLHRRRRNSHASHVKLLKCHSSEKLSNQTLVFDVEGGLLRSSSTFPYFMLVALEAGGFLRGLLLLLLLLLYPLVYCLSQQVGLRIMVMVSFCGLRKEKFRVGRAVLPKFFMEDVGLEGFEVMRRGGRRVCVSRMPRVMVEGFLKEYLEVEVVVGTELKVLGGIYTGFMEEGLDSKELFGEEEEVGGDFFGFGSYDMSLQHKFFSHCKEIYIVTEGEKRRWHPLPRDQYPKPLVFHDGRIAFPPTPLATLTMFLWIPLGVPLSVLRVLLFVLLPYSIAVPIGSFTGIKTRYSIPTQTENTHLHTRRAHHLYVCNHRTLLDPIYISTTLNKQVTAVTYSLSRLSELLSPVRTVRLTRNKEEDRKRMKRHLREGNLVVCPEGTTCREPYLLRFSPLFAELTDEIVPVALVSRVRMFYGTTASGFKWLDPFCFLMNPNPEYDLKFLEMMSTGRSGEEEEEEERWNSYEVANKVQRELGRVLGYDCTALTRKDKYLMLAGNEGIVEGKPKGQ